jgi:hypothetical protein
MVGAPVDRRHISEWSEATSEGSAFHRIQAQPANMQGDDVRGWVCRACRSARRSEHLNQAAALPGSPDSSHVTIPTRSVPPGGAGPPGWPVP